MSYTITKRYHFSASHQLTRLAGDHPCARLHGHNYIVEIELKSQSLNEDGFVRDYRDMDALKRHIDETLDHRHLNDIFGDDRVTSEHLAEYFYEWCKARWPETAAARISETPRTWAEYRPPS